MGDCGSGEAWISVVPDRRLPGVLGAYALSSVGRREVPWCSSSGSVLQLR